MHDTMPDHPPTDHAVEAARHLLALAPDVTPTAAVLDATADIVRAVAAARAHAGGAR